MDTLNTITILLINYIIIPIIKPLYYFIFRHFMTNRDKEKLLNWLYNLDEYRKYLINKKFQ